MKMKPEHFERLKALIEQRAAPTLLRDYTIRVTAAYERDGLAMTWGPNGTVIEPRYFWPILEGLLVEGFHVAGVERGEA
jgi:hypothetical protein